MDSARFQVLTPQQDLTFFPTLLNHKHMPFSPDRECLHRWMQYRASILVSIYSKEQKTKWHFLSKQYGIIWLLICFHSLNYLALYSIMLCTHTKISKREEWKRVRFSIFCFSPTDCGHETQSRVVVVAVSARALNLSKFWVLQWLILTLFLFFTLFMSILLILLHSSVVTEEFSSWLLLWNCLFQWHKKS